MESENKTKVRFLEKDELVLKKRSKLNVISWHVSVEEEREKGPLGLVSKEMCFSFLFFCSSFFAPCLNHRTITVFPFPAQDRGE
jgi:hypothetical protein